MYGIEKEMIEDYGVESSVWIGGKRIVLGINEENTEKPRYMSCIVSGFGAEANSRGSACYGWNLCRRKYERIERSEVMGIVPESLLPYVAKQTLEDIHHGFLTTDFEKKRGEER